MKYDLKPQDQRKVKLFAHRGEAIVFWISLGALIFLAIISLFRYFYLDKIADQYNKLVGEAHPIILQLKDIKAQNDSLKKEQTWLKESLFMMEDSTKQLKADMQKLRQEKLQKPVVPIIEKPKPDVIILPEY